MKTIHQVLDIETSNDNVWEALTTRDGLAGWWSTRVEVSDAAAVESVIDFTFGGNFNPDMEITAVDADSAVEWKCVGGHGPWADNTFRFEVEGLDGDRTRLRFWQHYATELSDDEYGIYNFNWGYYLQSLKELVETGSGKPFDPSAG
jgi:uncharacterized protein YndB with AHSA1/START domain